MGKVVAEMCTVAKTSISAELLRTITVIHHFATHAARTQRIWPCTSVERSEERLNEPLSSEARAAMQKQKPGFS